MGLRIATLADAISKLSVSGLTIADLDTNPASLQRSGPTLIPDFNYLTGFNIERQSTGGGSTAKMDATYNLRYRLLYMPAGAGADRGHVNFHLGLINIIVAFINAVLAIDTISGAEDIIPVGISDYGLVLDASNNPYFGCIITFQVLEFVNEGL